MVIPVSVYREILMAILFPGSVGFSFGNGLLGGIGSGLVGAGIIAVEVDITIAVNIV